MKRWTYFYNTLLFLNLHLSYIPKCILSALPQKSIEFAGFFYLNLRTFPLQYTLHLLVNLLANLFGIRNSALFPEDFPLTRLNSLIQFTVNTYQFLLCSSHYISHEEAIQVQNACIRDSSSRRRNRLDKQNTAFLKTVSINFKTRFLHEWIIFRYIFSHQFLFVFLQHYYLLP